MAIGNHSSKARKMEMDSLRTEVKQLLSSFAWTVPSSPHTHTLWGSQLPLLSKLPFKSTRIFISKPLGLLQEYEGSWDLPAPPQALSTRWILLHTKALSPDNTWYHF